MKGMILQRMKGEKEEYLITGYQEHVVVLRMLLEFYHSVLVFSKELWLLPQKRQSM